MQPLLTKLEKALEPVFKGLPPLPKNAKEWLVKAWPILAIIFGLLQILAAWSLWHVGHTVNSLVDYSNELSRVYGTGVTVHSLGLFYWLSLVVLVLEGAIFLLAYPGLKARRKVGWNMLFLGTIINVLYGIIAMLDSSYGGVGKLISMVIGSAIALYLLYQVRSFYNDKKPSVDPAHSEKQS